MKMSVMAYAYPIILRSVVKEQLRKHYSQYNIEDLFKKIRNEYKAILRRSPDIGGCKNIFMDSYLMGAYLIALYKNTKDKLSLADLDLIISEGLKNFEFMKKRMRKIDLLSVGYKNKIVQAGQWCKKNEDKFPDNWQVEVKQQENPDLTHIVFTKCGLCVLCKNEGVPEFIFSL
ncbi:MAG: L-2-amino-thiazoline-4-carboxylic acid hydrolase [Clostridiaceae bacterium]